MSMIKELVDETAKRLALERYKIDYVFLNPTQQKAVYDSAVAIIRDKLNNTLKEYANGKS